MAQQQTQKRTVVDVDTRRAVVTVARARKPRDVAEVPHEKFVRNALKDRLGWPRRDPAPESIKAAAKEIAAFLVKRDADAAKAEKEKIQKEAALKAKAAEGEQMLAAATA